MNPSAHNTSYVLAPDGSVDEFLISPGIRYEDALRAAINCSTLQLIVLRDGRNMWLDENGKFKTLPINREATRLLHDAGGALDDFIVGTVVIEGDDRPTDGETMIGAVDRRRS